MRRHPLSSRGRPTGLRPKLRPKEEPGAGRAGAKVETTMSAEIEKQVFDLVKKRLKAEDVSRDATWEQLGADSLDAAEFFMDLEDQLGVQGWGTKSRSGPSRKARPSSSTARSSASPRRIFLRGPRACPRRTDRRDEPGGSLAWGQGRSAPFPLHGAAVSARILSRPGVFPLN